MKTNSQAQEVEIAAIAKRLKRAQGQIGAVHRMLEEGRSCEEIVIQLSAVSKAINTAAFALISSNLEDCIINKRNGGDKSLEKLRKLFLSLV